MSGKREKKARKLEKRVEMLEHRMAVCEAWTPAMMHENQVEAKRSGFDLERTSHGAEALSLLAGTKHSGMREDETSPRRRGLWPRLAAWFRKEK